MALTERFIRYLEGSEAPAAMAAALSDAGYALEAAALAGEEASAALRGGPWEGARVWVGPTLPAGAAVGDVWVDTRALEGMVLLPWPPVEGAPEPLSWLALRPVTGWQLGAFLALTERSVRRESPGFEPFESSRMAGREDAPALGLTCGEALLVAHWFGKSLAAHDAWNAVCEELPAALDSLWGPREREWVEDVDLDDESLAAGLTREAAALEDLEDVEGVFLPPQTCGGVAFRTGVSVQLGLFEQLSAEGSTAHGARLLAPLSR